MFFGRISELAAAVMYSGTSCAASAVLTTHTRFAVTIVDGGARNLGISSVATQASASMHTWACVGAERVFLAVRPFIIFTWIDRFARLAIA